MKCKKCFAPLNLDFNKANKYRFMLTDYYWQDAEWQESFIYTKISEKKSVNIDFRNGFWSRDFWKNFEAIEKKMEEPFGRRWEKLIF